MEVRSWAPASNSCCFPSMGHVSSAMLLTTSACLVSSSFVGTQPNKIRLQRGDGGSSAAVTPIRQTARHASSGSLLRMFSEPEPEQLSDESSSSSSTTTGGSTAVAEPPPAGEDWSGFLMRERYAKLRDISLSISVRRTIDEAELALKLAEDFGADPSILQDIDFVSLMRRVDRDLRKNVKELAASDLVSKEELQTLQERQRAAIDSLQRLQPEALALASGAVAEAVPKIRRVISKARELPLAIELPSALSEADGLDLQVSLPLLSHLSQLPLFPI